MKVHITRHTKVRGQHVSAGKTVEVRPEDGEILISAGAARHVDPEHEEPDDTKEGDED